MSFGFGVSINLWFLYLLTLLVEVYFLVRVTERIHSNDDEYQLYQFIPEEKCTEIVPLLNIERVKRYRDKVLKCKRPFIFGELEAIKAQKEVAEKEQELH